MSLAHARDETVTEKLLHRPGRFVRLSH